MENQEFNHCKPTRLTTKQPEFLSSKQLMHSYHLSWEALFNQTQHTSLLEPTLPDASGSGNRRALSCDESAISANFQLLISSTFGLTSAVLLLSMLACTFIRSCNQCQTHTLATCDNIYIGKGIRVRM